MQCVRNKRPKWAYSPEMIFLSRELCLDEIEETGKQCPDMGCGGVLCMRALCCIALILGSACFQDECLSTRPRLLIIGHLYYLLAVRVLPRGTRVTCIQI